MISKGPEATVILITGASGHAGREVLREVIETGAKVRAAYQAGAKASLPAGVEAVSLDYNHPETVRAAIDGVDVVFLVGPPSAQLPELERKAVDVIASSPVKRLVKLSAMGGYDATFPRMHAESEDHIRSSGIQFTFLRPNGFMQNLINYSGATINSQNAIYGTEGDGRISIIDIRDVAGAAAKVLTEDGHIGKTYTLTGPQALSNSEVAEMLSQELGREIRFVNLTEEQYKQAALSAGVPAWTVDAQIDLQRLYREGKASAVTGDVQHLIGREPTPLAQFVHDFASAFQPVA